MTNIAQTEAVLVAVDIAKARHEVLIVVPGRTRRRRLTVLNQLDDFNRLIATLSDYGRPVRVAFEATGNYHRALAYRIGVAGFECTSGQCNADPGLCDRIPGHLSSLRRP